MNINTTHLSVDGPLTSKRLKLAICNFSGEDILAHCQPEYIGSLPKIMQANGKRRGMRLILWRICSYYLDVIDRLFVLKNYINFIFAKVLLLSLQSSR